MYIRAKTATMMTHIITTRPRYRIALYRYWPSTRVDRLSDVLCIARIDYSFQTPRCRIYNVYDIQSPLTSVTLTLLSYFPTEI